MTSLLLKSGRVIDPSRKLDAVADLLIRDGRIIEIGDLRESADTVIDCTRLIVSPGLIDCHVALRDPGYEEDETMDSGTAAALAGGFSTIAALPDTLPVVDNRASAEFVRLLAERSSNCRVYPLGAVTRGHAGQELADIGQLVEGGAVAFTDSKTAIASAEVLRRALEYTRMFDRPILTHPQDPSLAAGGVMHEGYSSTRLGLRGIPAAAEDIMVNRDLALAELTGSRLHLMCVSTAGAVDLIRRARQRGVRVTADVSPHHLALTDSALESYDSCFKVSPPLRGADDQRALIAGLQDGSIDAISADHQPWASEKKDRELDLVPAGVVGLETLLPICIATLVTPGHLTWPQLIAVLTVGPARALGIDHGHLKPGGLADVTLIDPLVKWTIDPLRFASRSRNTPFAGQAVTGRAAAVIVGGEIRYRTGLSNESISGHAARPSA